MPRQLRGIRRRRKAWEVYVNVNRRRYTTTFPLLTSFPAMRAWREDQIAKFGGDCTTAGSFGADIATYLSRVTTMPTYKQRAAHLELWAKELGRDRPREAITPQAIDHVLQRWLLTCAPATVKKRRTALQSFFAKMDGGKTARRVNPVKFSDNPKEPKPEARAIDYLRIAAAIAEMPTHTAAKPGQVGRLCLAPLRVRVLAYTGMPPGILQQIRATDLSIANGTVRVVPRHKGAGVEARTLQLTSEALDAFKAFHAANAYGRFSTDALNRSFKRGCKSAGFDATSVHLYDLRHSFLTALYQVTRDLATVGRFGLHAEGSKVTARYAKGADQAVDTAASAALGQFLATSRQLALKLAPLPNGIPNVASKRGRG